MQGIRDSGTILRDVTNYELLILVRAKLLLKRSRVRAFKCVPLMLTLLYFLHTAIGKHASPPISR